jgi:hypothetical protein
LIHYSTSIFFKKTGISGQTLTINNRPPKIPYYPTAEASTEAIDSNPLVGEDAVAGAAKAGVKIGAGAIGVVIIKNAIKQRGLWRLTEQGALRIARHPKFGKLYKSASDGTWWTVDRAKHGGSAFKVFKEEYPFGEGHLSFLRLKSYLANIDNHGEKDAITHDAGRPGRTKICDHRKIFPQSVDAKKLLCSGGPHPPNLSLLAAKIQSPTTLPARSP